MVAAPYFSFSAFDDDEPFAMLHRPAMHGDNVEILRGEVLTLRRLSQLTPLTDVADVLAMVPYRQLRERGIACNDDDAPLLALKCGSRHVVPRRQLIEDLPDGPIDWTGFQFDVPDEHYEDIVRSVLANEIGTGAGSNFVISRALRGSWGSQPVTAALALYRRLLATERSAYWTFLAHTGPYTFVGATPEAHVVLDDGHITMNPISGTYRYPSKGPSLPELLQFLRDQKEIDELFMVVDEELKMMSQVCAEGATAEGPWLKEMSRLAHTEYVLRGRGCISPADLLRETMFAPTVMGSPLRNAARVIARYEPGGRGYYSGAIAFIDRDPMMRPRLDSAIMIRTAVVDEAGQTRVGVGSTLVRNSDPHRETQETHAKAAAMVGGPNGVPSTAALANTPLIVAALAERNQVASPFWLAGRSTSNAQLLKPLSRPRQALLIDAEDDFTAMVAAMLRALGLTVSIARATDGFTPEEYDLTIFGPGPGDPTAYHEARIMALHCGMQTMMERDLPFAAVCLSHQVLCGLLGLPIFRLDTPHQGTGRDIELFGQRARVGFYNSFVARSNDDLLTSALAGRVDISRDEHSGEVFALRGQRFESWQFHAESILSRDGRAILARTIQRLISDESRRAATG